MLDEPPTKNKQMAAAAHGATTDPIALALFI
jgi:hypothetical protein